MKIYTNMNWILRCILYGFLKLALPGVMNLSQINRVELLFFSPDGANRDLSASDLPGAI